MTIIFKDFHNFKRINSIARENLDDIKAYLNEIGIIFSEGTVAMNWNNVLAQIREDFEAFLDDGGWRFLQDDGEDEEEGEVEDSELANDPAFTEDDDGESDFSDDESDFSDEDEEGSSSDVASDSEEDAVSWDEMEKRALEDDKRAAMRR